MVGLDPKTGNGKRGDMGRLQGRIRLKHTESRTQRKSISWLNRDVAPEG